jgi:hypothetical protein
MRIVKMNTELEPYAGKAQRLKMIFLKSLLFRHSKSIRDYFADAVRIYILRGEEAARCAAIAAAKGAGKKQRQFMIESLSKMALNVMRNSPDRVTRKSIADRILSLKDAVELKDGRAGDFKAEIEKLSKMNEEYLASFNRADPSVFKRKHPQLF